MSWIPGTTWNANRGRQLVELLSSIYPSEAAMLKLLDDSGVSRGNMPAPMPLILRWHEITHRLHSAQMLGQLLNTVYDDFPVLVGRLEELAEDDRTIPVGNPPDPYEVRLLGPGRRPMIDRTDLRNNLRRFITERLPVLVVRGPAQSGKSFSFELMKHVAGGRDDLRLVWVDFSSPACGNTASELMSMICSRLGLKNICGRTRRTTPTRFAAELVNDLVGVYRFKDSATRVLVVDGLDRIDLQSDVSDLAAQLAIEVIHDQLTRTQLVLTGYNGSFNRQMRYDILTEDVATITESHIRLHFQGLVLSRELASAELDELVFQAMEFGDNLEELGDRVRELSLALIDV